ncbi:MULTISPECIES: substrate-binding domain-containing protein [Clostridium]|uniref:Substrate-binding domain-containing protein n=1 Tax=Clostridium butyricum TaxID=1492 RepID=A0AAP9RCT8_CLOBU|nr:MULTISPECIES: substrate-binding domain-containing protein [Clostridium]MBZ5748176.1 substrate-binding domain-containing protein [Clostridium butyricum]MDI9210405.1 substrate-binding domain-containing protein [Clostridium butyricum]MDU2894890.1 substrate-binding domain-containing protein [Clostridium sp.]MDU3007179.1 substrate-binding domain-containing protein [Clostridium sp.]MDU3037067.1 substrate-binding domain-containing protein [Clostridium sp.]
MKIKERIIYIFFIIIFILSIVTFSVYVNKIQVGKNKKILIGMSQANLYEPWRVYMNSEIEEESKKHGDVQVIYKDAGGDTEKQKRDINDLIDFGVDLLIVSINDSTELTPKVKEAYKTIPVIVLDRAVEGYDYTLYIGSHIKSIGEQAGALVADLADNKKLKVVEIQGLLNSSPDREMTEGFKEVLKKHDNISIDRTIVANWQKNESQDKLQEILQQDQNIDVIFAHSDYMALGAYYALKSMNKNDVKIIGVDGLQGEEGGIELVKNGILEGTFTCKTGGKEAIQYAIKILNKEQDIPKKILLECNKITKDSLK